jgi:hypothetical protein
MSYAICPIYFTVFYVYMSICLSASGDTASLSENTESWTVSHGPHTHGSHTHGSHTHVDTLTGQGHTYAQAPPVSSL